MRHLDFLSENVTKCQPRQNTGASQVELCLDVHVGVFQGTEVSDDSDIDSDEDLDDEDEDGDDDDDILDSSEFVSEKLYIVVTPYMQQGFENVYTGCEIVLLVRHFDNFLALV